jgi:hypothetical protein
MLAITIKKLFFFSGYYIPQPEQSILVIIPILPIALSWKGIGHTHFAVPNDLFLHEI